MNTSWEMWSTFFFFFLSSSSSIDLHHRHFDLSGLTMMMAPFPVHHASEPTFTPKWNAVIINVINYICAQVCLVFIEYCVESTIVYYIGGGLHRSHWLVYWHTYIWIFWCNWHCKNLYLIWYSWLYVLLSKLDLLRLTWHVQQ